MRSSRATATLRTNGPDVWITPPHYPAFRSVRELGQAISQATSVDAPTVLRAMSEGVAPQARRALGLSVEQSQPPARAYLDVPYGEKDAAKAHGARRDQQARRWYDPRPPTAGLQQWAASPEVPEVLPGEDRTFGSGLFVDMIPRSCWFTNVRTCVSPRDWERLARMVYGRAGNRCEACGAEPDRAAGRRMEAHERWAYDEDTGVQALRRLICLCNQCHLSTHLGFANVTGRSDQALAHLRAVTGMNDAEASRHVHAAGALWTARSQRAWTLDLTMLTDAGVALVHREPAVARLTAAERALPQAQTPAPAPIPAPRPKPGGSLNSAHKPSPGLEPNRRGLWTRITGRS